MVRKRRRKKQIMQVYGVTSFYVKYESFEKNLLCLLENNVTHSVCNSINKGKA